MCSDKADVKVIDC